LVFAALDRGGLNADPLLVAGATDRTMSELLARSVGPIALVGEDASLEATTNVESGFRRSLWLAPDTHDWQHTATRIDGQLSQGGWLAIIGSGPLAGALERVRPGALGIPKGTARPQQIRRFLNYRAAGEWRLYGARSAAWAALRMAADHVGRPDLADRWQAAFQQALVEPATCKLCGIRVSLSRKPAGS
jgi:hypothetical protein